MREAVAGTAIGLSLIALVPAAIAATESGWSHAWGWGFAASFAILFIGGLLAVIAPKD